MNLLIFIADSNGCYPVPASKGGAVSTLVELLVAGNEIKKLVDMTVISYYDEKAFELSRKYPSIKFIWIKTPVLVKWMDKAIYSILSCFPKVHATSFLSFLTLLHYTFKASQLLRKRKNETVVLEHNIPMMWMIKWSGFKGKYFHHLHNIPRTNAKCMEVVSKCNGYICISQFMADQIMSYKNPIGPVPAEKVALLYNCIDITLFHPIEHLDQFALRTKYNLSPNSKIIVFSGRMTWEKGIDKLLDSLDFIQTENVEVLIVGSLLMTCNKTDTYIERLQKKAQQYKEKVHFTGYIQHDKLPELYNLGDVAVLPSMWEEPAGLTMLEAMACGTPVITTRSGGIPEYVGNAAIILERDENLKMSIAKSIDKLLNDNEYYQDMRKQGIERIQKYFNSDCYINKFVDIIYK